MEALGRIPLDGNNNNVNVLTDEETIPDATDADALTSNRVTALIANDKDLEEGSSSHDGPELMKLNGDDLSGNN